MSVGQRVLWVFCDRLIEVVVLIFSDIFLRTRPNRLDLIDGLPFPDLLGNSLHLGLLLVVLVGSLILAFVSDLHVVLGDFLFFFFLFYVVSNDFVAVLVVLDDFDCFLLGGVHWHLHLLVLAQIQLDRVVDEFRVLFHKVLDLVLLDEFDCVVLEVEGYTSSSAKRVATGILGEEEL